MLVRRVDEQPWSIETAPAVDELIVRDLGEFVREAGVNLERMATTCPEEIHPGAERFGINALPAGELGNVDFALGRICLGSHGQTPGRAGKYSLPTLDQFAADLAHIAQQQIRPAGCRDSRPFPEHEIVCIAIACIRSDKIKRDSLSVGRSRNLESDVLLSSQRIYRLHPGLWSAQLADVSDSIESPKRLLPLSNRRSELGGLAQIRIPPPGAQLVEQQRRSAAGKHVEECAQVFGIQTTLARDGN